jgi:cytochrome P450
MQLQASIPEGYSSWDYSKVKTLSYIDDIIHETLRLKPPIIQGMPRETPPQGIHIGDQYIPGHVVVSVPTLLVQRDPRWWEQPEYFIPERWDERREVMKTDDGPWIPFQIGELHLHIECVMLIFLGMHACAGKSLAYMSKCWCMNCI